LNHLSPETKLVLEKSVEERISWVQRPRWISYPQAAAILDRLEDMLSHPRQHRMPGLRLIGDSNNGKSHLIEEFKRRHPPSDNYGGDHIVCPVLVIETPPSAKESDLYRQILTTLFKRVPSSPGALRDDAVEVLKAIQVKVLIFDELSNMVASADQKQRQSLNAIKYLANTLEVSIVGAGIRDLDRVMLLDPQLQNRLRPMELPIWRSGKESKQLMKSLEMLLPFPQTSNLYSTQTCNFILAKAGGLIGEVCQLVTAAAVYALKKERPCIDEDAILNCAYQSPDV
jgi:hypothetical protein